MRIVSNISDLTDSGTVALKHQQKSITMLMLFKKDFIYVFIQISPLPLGVTSSTSWSTVIFSNPLDLMISANERKLQFVISFLLKEIERNSPLQ